MAVRRSRPGQRPGRRGGRPAAAATAAGAPVELLIERIGDRGDGIAAHTDGPVPDGPVYVPLTVPGDRVLVQLGARRGEGREAEIAAITDPGPDRVAPPCRHFGHCGGCALQHWADPAVAAWKRQRVVAALARVGLGDVAVDPVITTPPATRRRAAFVAVRTATTTVLGFQVRRGDEVVDVAQCPLLDPPIVAALPALRAGLSPLLALRDRLAVVVTRLDLGLDVLLDWPAPPDLATREALVRLAADADLVRLSWRRPPDGPAEPLVVRRPAVVRPGGSDVAVVLPPGGFLQASAAGEAALVDAAAAAVAPVAAAGGRIADLFAGAGTFSLALIAAGARVHAVDGDEALIAALASAGAAARLSALTTERRDLFQRPLSVADLKRFQAVVFDPPRAGARAQAEALAGSAVSRIAAVSCNPATFARDARTLVDGGYRLLRVTPVDQFRWSAHVELVADFRR